MDNLLESIVTELNPAHDLDNRVLHILVITIRRWKSHNVRIIAGLPQSHSKAFLMPLVYHFYSLRNGP